MQNTLTSSSIDNSTLNEISRRASQMLAQKNRLESGDFGGSSSESSGSVTLSQQSLHQLAQLLGSSVSTNRPRGRRSGRNVQFHGERSNWNESRYEGRNRSEQDRMRGYKNTINQQKRVIDTLIGMLTGIIPYDKTLFSGK